MSIAVRLTIVFAGSILILLGALFYARLGLIFIFDPEEARPTGIPRTEIRTLPEFGDDPALNVWVTTPQDGQPVVIYFMGHAGSLSVDAQRLRRIANAGFGIAAMAYRGGGGQEGKPSAENLYRDALRVFAGLDSLFERVIPDTDRVIYGYSLGTGLATRLAEEQEELALILEAPFTDLCAIKSGLIAIVPGCWLYAGQDFGTIDRIGGVETPVLILHGDLDETVPVRHAQMLFAEAQDPKFMEIYSAGGHENLARFGAGDDAITFIRILRGER